MFVKRTKKAFIILLALLLLTQMSVPLVMALPSLMGFNDANVLEYDFSEPEYDEDYLTEEDDTVHSKIKNVPDPDYLLDYDDRMNDVFIDFDAVNMCKRTIDAPPTERIGIDTEEDLLAFLNGTLIHNGSIAPNHAHYELNADIVLTQVVQGRGLVNSAHFTGIFDGRGHTISNMQLMRSDGAYVGFLQQAGGGAVLRNITFHFDAHIPAFNKSFQDNTENLRVGMLVGHVHSGLVTIDNVHFTGETLVEMGWGNTSAATTSANSMKVGGMVGYVAATGALNIHNVGAEHIELSNTSTANRNLRQHSVGGLIGNTHGNVRISATQGDVNHIAVSVSGMEYFDTLRLPERAGGVIGFVGAGHVVIEDTVVSGLPHLTSDDLHNFIRATNFVGGFIGATNNNGSVVIRNAVNYINVAASRPNLRAGGIIGRAGMPVTLEHVENYGIVSAPNSAHSSLNPSGACNGGIIGRLDGATTMYNIINYGRVENASHRSSSLNNGFIGGLVGFANHALEITDSANHAVVTREGNRENSDSHAGGIIGFVNNDSPAAFRRTVLKHVHNTGDVNTHEPVRISDSMTTRHAGGIIGSVRDAVSVVVELDHVSNTGNIRGRFNVGGIIGHANARNITISNAMNKGLVLSMYASRRAGGIVGLANRADLTIINSGNAGVVHSISGSRNNGGIGGIVGSTTGARTNIENCFNLGYVHSENFRTGGIVGQSRSSTNLNNVYNIGTIRSGAVRGGSGLVGQRRGGTTHISNAYVSADVGGASVAVSGTERSRPVTGLVFHNVFVDSSTARFAPDSNELQGNRNGITVVSTELLTSGLLPGISNGMWLYGIEKNEHQTLLTYEQRTLPYFTWQTQDRMQTQFFDSIDPVLDTEYTGDQLLATYEGVDSTQTFLVFNPYRENPTSAYETGAHLPLPESNQVMTQRVSGNHHISMGLISTQYVVGFSCGDIPERFFVMAYDETGGEGVVIGHALFTSNLPMHAITLDEKGIYIGVSRFADDDLKISVHAAGYQSVYDLPIARDAVQSGVVLIPMTRTAMDVMVFVRQPQTESQQENDVLGHVINDSSFLYQGISIEQCTGSEESPFYMLNNVFVGDGFEASAPGFRVFEDMIDPMAFRQQEDGMFILNNGYYLLDVHLEDFKLPAFDIVPYYRVMVNDDDVMMFFNEGSLANGRFSRLDLEADDAGGIAPKISRASTVVNDSNLRRWEISDATEVTAFRVVDQDFEFAATEWFYVGIDDFEEDDNEQPIYRIYVELVREPSSSVRIATQSMYFLSERSNGMTDNKNIYPEDVYYFVLETTAYPGAGKTASDVRIQCKWPQYLESPIILYNTETLDNTVVMAERDGDFLTFHIGNLEHEKAMLLIFSAKSNGFGLQDELILQVAPISQISRSTDAPLFSCRIAARSRFMLTQRMNTTASAGYVIPGDVFQFETYVRAQDHGADHVVIYHEWPAFLNPPQVTTPNIRVTMLDNHAVFYIGDLILDEEITLIYHATATSFALQDELLPRISAVVNG